MRRPTASSSNDRFGEEAFVAGPTGGSGSGVGGGAGGSAIRSVLVLAGGAFSVGSCSFVVVGLQPEIAQGLGISGAGAGQLVTVFAITYGVSVPLLAAATDTLPRRPLMAFALALLGVATAAGGLAPDLGLLIATRMVAALAAALFTPTASAAALAMVAPEWRGRALSFVLAGLAAGILLGVPVGTIIGQEVGWRIGIAVLGALPLGVAAALFALLPRLHAPRRGAAGDRRARIPGAAVLSVVAVTTAGTGAGMVVYTYLAEVLAGIGAASALPLALAAWGVGGVAGVLGSGWATDRIGPQATILVALTLAGLAASALAIDAGGALGIGLVGIVGLGTWSIATPNNHRLGGMDRPASSLALSLNSSGIYLGQALGAGLGGLALAQGAGGSFLCLLSGVASFAAAGLEVVANGPD
ncbi:MAG: MFS transporter [Actinobacteria bacterium]|nr:MFS transporter [Actinomycetota bacterium]